MKNYADLMFQGAVADLQKAEGVFEKFQKYYVHRTQDGLSEQDITFIKSRDSFYIASNDADGWPYVQHRGGARGFVHIMGSSKLVCADYHGNQQFITMGHLQNDARVSLFFMDYLNHARLKIQGTATLKPVQSAPPEFLAQIQNPNDPVAERILEIDIVSMDWNCPKYIPTLYPEDVIRQVVGGQIAQLQAENQKLKDELSALQN